MNCHECRERLHERLDGAAAAPDAAADAHLAACAECRALFAAAGRLGAGLRRLAPPAPPDGMGQRIAAEVLADQRGRRRMRRLVFAGAVALAASLLIALFATPGARDADGWREQTWASVKNYFDPQPPAPDDLKRIAPDAPPRGPEKLPQPAPAPSLNENVSEASSAVASLAKRTTDEAVSGGQLLVPAVTLPMPDDDMMAQPLDPPAQSLREAGHGVAAGLAPVTNGARRAFDRFLHDIPPAAPEAKPGL